MIWERRAALLPSPAFCPLLAPAASPRKFASVNSEGLRIEETWVWAGNSLSALETPSRANACFDSHVNGGLVMKELKIPWMNWESSTGTILLKA